MGAILLTLLRAARKSEAGPDLKELACISDAQGFTGGVRRHHKYE
jgi:hypothetical protein